MCETLKKMITSKTNNDYILSKTWQYIECDYILIFFFLQIIYMSYAKTNETRNTKGKQSQNVVRSTQNADPVLQRSARTDNTSVKHGYFSCIL